MGEMLKSSAPQNHHQYVPISTGLRILISVCILFFIWSIAGYLVFERNSNLGQMNGSSNASLLVSIINEIFNFYFKPLALLVCTALISPIFIAREIVVNSVKRGSRTVSPGIIRKFLNYFVFSLGKTPSVYIRNNHAGISAELSRLNQLGGPAEIISESNQAIIIQDDGDYYSMSNPDKNKALKINLGFGEKLLQVQSIERNIRIENLKFQSFDENNMRLESFSICFQIGIENRSAQEIEYQKITKQDAYLLMNSAHWDNVIQELLTSLLENFFCRVNSENLRKNVFDSISTKKSTVLDKEESIPKEEYENSKRNHSLYTSQPATFKNRGFHRNRLRRLYSNATKETDYSSIDIVKGSRIDRYELIKNKIEDVINPLIEPIQIKIVQLEFGEITYAK